MQKELEEYLEELDDKTLVDMWNEYCMDEDYDNQIYETSEFDEIMDGQEPSYIADRIYYGDYNPTLKYFKFNGYGNLESISSYEITDYIYISELADYIIRNDEDFNDNEIREILDKGENEDDDD